MKTSELNEAALDWAVAQCEGLIGGDSLDIGFIKEGGYTPSTNWAQGGAIIERERISVALERGEPWAAWSKAAFRDDAEAFGYGITPLVAAMRCYVASKLGDDVAVPEELAKMRNAMNKKEAMLCQLDNVFEELSDSLYYADKVLYREDITEAINEAYRSISKAVQLTKGVTT